MTLVDAASYQTQHILYEQGAYNGYSFSHDGRYLALAIDRRVELWDAQTGQMSVRFEPEGANLVQGPLIFSPDDTWLLLDTVVPAPQATRRSENDTNIIPWLWDLPAARDEAPARLNGGAEAFAFFNFRNGLVMGGNLFFIAGIPNRLQVIDGRTNAFDVVADIPSSRAERDPIYVWHSVNSDLMYVNPQVDNQFVQVDAQIGAVFDLPLGRNLNYTNLESMRDLRLGASARLLCQPNSLRETPLLRLLYGEEYLRFQSYQPQTFMLIDVLEPLSTGATQPALLIYNFVEAQGRGTLELLYPQDTLQMRLSPDGTHLLLRRASGLQPIEVYNLETCGLEQTLYPAEPDETGSRLLDYRADGQVIVSDFQRFEARGGAQVAFEEQYTTGFEEYRFSDDGRHLHTLRAGELWVWELATGQLLQRAPIRLNGDVIARSPDATRYLTQSFDGNVAVESMDVLGGERRQLIIPTLGSVERLIPSPDWQRVLIT